MNEAFADQQELLPGPSNGDVPIRAGAKKAGAPRWLPFSKQFSPQQVQSLGDFLGIVESQAVSKDQTELAFLRRFRPGSDPSNQQLRTMAYNAVLSAQHYGLVNARLELTDLGRQLRDASDERERLQILARHILQHLNGIELVHGLDGISRAG